jgi:hypothetical protein
VATETGYRPHSALFDIDRANPIVFGQFDDHASQLEPGCRLQPSSFRDGQNVTKHDDGRCRVDQEGGDLLIRKIVGRRKQTFSGDNGILGPVATFPINYRDARPTLLTHAIEKNDQDFEEFRRKVLALMSENEAHASKIPSVARLVEQRRRH